MSTAWTVQDLAELTRKASLLTLDTEEQSYINNMVFCEWCTVIPVQEGDKYCAACANEVVEYLAERFEESIRIEKGWY